MSAARKNTAFPRRTMVFAGVLFVVDVGGARALDALGLVEGLLSPNEGRLLWLLPLAGVFYLARLTLLFAAPGLVLGSLVIWGLERKAKGAGDDEPRRDVGAPRG